MENEQSTPSAPYAPFDPASLEPVPVGLSFGDGFLFGCGFFAAGIIATIIVLLLILLVLLLVSLTGVGLFGDLLSALPMTVVSIV